MVQVRCSAHSSMLSFCLTVLQSPSMESPPTYESAMEGTSVHPAAAAATSPDQNTMGKDAKMPPPMPPPPHSPALYGATMSTTTPVIYHYQHPVTGDHVASLLPPDHPQMVCLQRGYHDTETRYGLLGVLAAVLWFPLGIGLCLLDRKVRCRSCGEHISDGICG
ncbi:hypothetical protein OF83DRAFT_1126379 [Amylostereum chailletii]|nr:hypothetical protein OF83DRAFT_1126379 [Amylostereum chailletii]